MNHLVPESRGQERKAVCRDKMNEVAMDKRNGIFVMPSFCSIPPQTTVRRLSGRLKVGKVRPPARRATTPTTPVIPHLRGYRYTRPGILYTGTGFRSTMTMSADVGNTTVDTIGVTNGEGTTEKWTNANNSSNDSTSYLDGLEDRLKMRSDQLEDLHLEAAIDAQLTAVVVVNSKKKYNIIQHQQTESEESISNHSIPIFDDYVNPHAVHNCLSPFVPTQSQRIEAMLDWVGLHNNDVFLDIGCGDGRVCVAAAKLKRTILLGHYYMIWIMLLMFDYYPFSIPGCRAIGMDVSPLCMEMATKVAQEEGVERQCSFYQADATLDPEMLLALGMKTKEATTLVDWRPWLFSLTTCCLFDDMAVL
jgi:hypothetical protein